MTRKKLTNIISVLKNEMGDFCSKSLLRRLDDLQEDINNDAYTIVVLGEFKRGKSTFVNSLLETKLLPADITPTTATINQLKWDQDKKTRVIKNNGEIETTVSSYDFLNKFTADNDFNPNEIKYLSIGYPAEILKNNVVIVDTPGVSDINEQRVQITYDFVPRANVVIFLLDATSFLKKTEKEFIDEHISKIGYENIVFIANKFDCIDEEEAAVAFEEMRKRLSGVFNKPILLPMSSQMALEGVLSKNNDIIKYSGLADVKNMIKQIIENGMVTSQRDQQFVKRLKDLIGMIEREIQSDISLKTADLSTLKIVLDNINNSISQESGKKQKISEYVQNEQQSISTMISKSINYFYSYLKEEIDQQIEEYKGLDFKEFIESRIANSIKKSFRRWVGTNYSAIDRLLDKLEREVSLSLANYFQIQVAIKSKNATTDTSAVMESHLITIEANDISNVNLRAGLLTAGAAGILTLIGGPILIPFVSMAAFPFLQRKMMAEKLKEAKINVKPEINAALYECVNKLNIEIQNNVSNRISNIIYLSEQSFDNLFTQAKQKIQDEINWHLSEQQNQIDDIELLESALSKIKSLSTQLSQITVK